MHAPPIRVTPLLHQTAGPAGSTGRREYPPNGSEGGAPGQAGHAGIAGSSGQVHAGTCTSGQAGPRASQMETLWHSSHAARAASLGKKTGMLPPL